MIQISEISATKANEKSGIPDYQVIPLGAALYVMQNRLLKPFAFLLALKRAYPSGNAKVSPEEMRAIAATLGVKQWRTVTNWLQVLQKHGFLRYRECNLRLWSLYRKFGEFKRGLRYFPTLNLRQFLFAGIAYFFIRLNRSKQRKSEKQSGHLQCAFVTDGISLAFLSSVLRLSRVRCSQLKKNPFMLVEHRFKLSTLTKFDVLHIRNDYPEQGRKYVVRYGQVYRQIVDRMTIEGIEMGRRRVA